MESKYLPPHLRNKNMAKVVPVVEDIIENKFPTLGVEASTMRSFVEPTGKSFANLVSDWAKDAEQQREADELKKRYNEHNDYIHRHHVIPLPKFHNIRHFVEPEDDEVEKEDSNHPIVNPEEEGWIEVRHKKKTRRPKTFEEKMARPPTPDENSKDDTVWNADDNDSYWN